MLKGKKDGVMIIKPGRLKIGSTKYGQMISDFCRKVDNCTLLGYYVSSFLTTTRCIVTQKKPEEHSSYSQMSRPSCWEQHEGRHQPQESLQSKMPGSNCETWRWICDDLGKNVLVFCWTYSNSEWSNYCK